LFGSQGEKKNHRPLPKAETEFHIFSPEVGWRVWPLLCGGGPVRGLLLLAAGQGERELRCSSPEKRLSGRPRGVRTGAT